MKKIVFGITSLDQGGAERVLVDLANKISNEYDITIFTLYPIGKFMNQLNKNVKIVSVFNKNYNELTKFEKLKISYSLLIPFFRKKIYDKFIKDKFDLEISFLEGPITWIFASKNKVKKIAWIHNDIEEVFKKEKFSFLKQMINKKCYKNYDKLVFVSKDNLNKFNNYFNIDKPKVVIYNYLDDISVKEKAEETNIKLDSISFVQVSRLVNQKAVSRLIEVHKKLIDDGFKHNIYVIGEGPLKEQLQNRINELNIGKTFNLMGSKNNPYPYIKNADYMILTSYYEGYGMVLVEGKILNKFIMITDCAAREALIDYSDKLIVENSFDGLYNGFKEIITTLPKTKNKSNYNNNKIIEQIYDLIEGV